MSSPVPAFVADVDGTLVAANTTTELLRFALRGAPLLRRLERRWMFDRRLPGPWLWAARGRWLDGNDGRLVAIRLLQGLPLPVVEHAAELALEEAVLPTRQGGPWARLEAAAQAGARVVLASAGLEPMIRRLAEHIGCEYRCSTLEVVDGRLTGRLDVDLHACKAPVLSELAANGHATTLMTDNLSDVEALRAADLRWAVAPARRRSRWTALGVPGLEFVDP